MFGVLNNTFLLWLFVKKFNVFGQFFYQMWLCLFDWFICVLYLLVFSVCNLSKLLDEWTLLNRVYHRYAIGAIYWARVAQISSPYFLIFATMERWIYITQRVGKFG